MALNYLPISSSLLLAMNKNPYPRYTAAVSDFRCCHVCRMIHVNKRTERTKARERRKISSKYESNQAEETTVA